MNAICSFILAASLAAALAPCVQAHPSRQVKAAELHVFGDRLVLFLRYEISEPRFATDLRARFDGDADRRLSTDERARLAAYVETLATEDLRVVWDGARLDGEARLRATSGLDRDLPSAYPVVLYWQIDFLLPASTELRFDPLAAQEGAAAAAGAAGRRHELELSDREARWESDFSCTVRFAPGVDVEEDASEPDPGRFRTFGFQHGSGSLRMSVSFKKPRRDG